MNRWLALVLALALVAAALYTLGSDGEPEEIDAASRARLERVLERADREAAP